MIDPRPSLHEALLALEAARAANASARARVTDALRELGDPPRPPGAPISTGHRVPVAEG